jgi:WD40 repeat protein
VTGSDDRKVKVVAVETGQIIYDTAFHNDWVRAVLYTTEFFISSSDDRQVALPKLFPVLNEGNRTVRIYDASTGVTSGEAWSPGPTGYIKAIAISPDSKILAAGSDDCLIRLYNMETRTMTNHPLRGHSSVSAPNNLHIVYSDNLQAIRSLAFSKDGQLLASCSDDQTVRLWDVHSGRKICDPLYGHTSCVSSVVFSPDMKQLVTGKPIPSKSGFACHNCDGQVVKILR